MAVQPKNPWPGLAGRKVLLAPSLLACDFARAGVQIDQVLAAGADVLHVDIMDGHFVPNLSMGPGFVQKIRRYTDAPLDVHLMVSDPEYFTEKFADAGADSINFHIEAHKEPAKLIKKIRARGLGAALTVKPATDAAALAECIGLVDMILVMTVEPGYGGQKFMADMLDKIRRIRAMLRPGQRLEVDGGINPQTAALCVQAGADVLVAGENVFGAADIPAAVEAIRKTTNK